MIKIKVVLVWGSGRERWVYGHRHVNKAGRSGRMFLKNGAVGVITTQG